MTGAVARKLGAYARFCFGLRGFLRDQITIEESVAVLQERMRRREENFLRIVKRGVFENEKSPYLPLLQMTKYSYKDVESLLGKYGVEGALRALKDDGIWVGIDEFKGTTPLVRDGQSFHVKESDFDNPYLHEAYEVESGATRSAGTRIRIDYEFLRDKTVNDAYILNMHGVLKNPIASWFPLYPGAPGINSTLRFNKLGNPPERWFSQVARGSHKVPLENRLGTNYLLLLGRFMGAKIPKPEFVNLNDASSVARWAAQTLTSTEVCMIYTFASSAVRVCQAAKEHNLDIKGTRFFVTGEPLTPKKREIIESLGGLAVPIYGISEGGVLAAGCMNAEESDDCHIYKDSYAVIQRKRSVSHSDVLVNAFLFTSLLPSSPKILLNVEMGDYGNVRERKCGCPFDELGYFEHISNIRSFEKLTGEGVTFVDTDFVKIIEEILPAKFGGGATDYQVVEEEDGSGLTRLIILVSPRVGEVRDEEVLQVFMGELFKGDTGPASWAETGTRMWRQAHTVSVKRTRPVATKRGKILPFHIVSQRG
jgi:hypothetical protein